MSETKVDYTGMRVGKVLQRWTYKDRDGKPRQGQSKVEKCPACSKNAVREFHMGTFVYVHSKTVDTSSGIFAVQRGAVACHVKAPEGYKGEFPGHYCADEGCWREAGKDSEGLCSKHQRGPSGGAIRQAIEALLTTHRLGEEQFADGLKALAEKLGTK